MKNILLKDAQVAFVNRLLEIMDMDMCQENILSCQSAIAAGMPREAILSATGVVSFLSQLCDTTSHEIRICMTIGSKYPHTNHTIDLRVGNGFIDSIQTFVSNERGLGHYMLDGGTNGYSYNRALIKEKVNFMKDFLDGKYKGTMSITCTPIQQPMAA